ncbi:MAG: class I SAM-dependent methyltransferase [Actinomycetota bacterium]|nr:class I SAM-dependent methyltransferase [Actinomycetota bacterium]
MKAAIGRLLRRLGLLKPAAAVLRALALGRESLRRRVGRDQTAGDGLPLPPPRLMYDVGGNPGAAWFLEGGAAAKDSILEALAQAGAPIESMGRILDFGCGCGRVVRHWSDLEGVEVYGSDLDPEFVAWCQENLPFGSFSTNGLAPPLPYEDGAFGFVYALSVFTHLTEPLQDDWIEELARVLEPGGHLLVTTQGEGFLPRLTADEREAFQSGRLIVRDAGEAGTNVCSVYHPRSYLERQFGKLFAPVVFEPEGARGNPPQDQHVLRKKS